MNLYGNSSFSKLPDSIGNLENLKILKLGETYLVSLPESMGKLTNLKELPLSYSESKRYNIVKKSFNYWSCSPPSYDTNYGRINTSLDLSGKKLKQIPIGVYMITELKEFDISNNQLTKIPPLLKELKYLEKLYIHNNPNLNHLPDIIWNMKYLKELKIDGKIIKDLPKDAKISLCQNLDNDVIVDLIYDGKTNKKLNDQELSSKTGPYIVYLTKN